MRRCRVSFLLLPPCALLAACSGTQVDRQAAAASTVADAWNDVARPAIVRTYENDQRAAVDALCPAERTDCPRPPLVAAVAAVRARWQPVWDLSEAARAAHYAVYAESVRNLGTPVFPKALFGAVLDAFGADADILTVSQGETPVASVLSLYHKGAVMPYWGGGVREARSLRANDVMYYALMNHARRRGCNRFDFGRSKINSGPYFFKKNWGFEPQPLSYAVRTADGAEPRDVNPNSPKYKAQIAVWQKLPLPIANLVGPWIAKGLG